MGRILEAFWLRSHFCGEIGPSSTRSLLACAPDDIMAGAIVAPLTDAWPGTAYRCGFPRLCRGVNCRA
jgi:hypothetical protein